MNNNNNNNNNTKNGGLVLCVKKEVKKQEVILELNQKSDGSILILISAEDRRKLKEAGIFLKVK